MKTFFSATALVWCGVITLVIIGIIYILKRNKENDKEVLLKKAVSHTNEIVYKLANENEELKGMGTTIVAARIASTC